MKQRLTVALMLSLVCGIAEAQSVVPEDARKGLQTLSQALQAGTRGNGGRGSPPGSLNRVPRATGAWWTDTALVARLGITSDQKKTIEGIFERYRSDIVAARADLDIQEALLARMLDAESMEAPPAFWAQIDRVIQARAGVERTYARMTLEIRRCLTRAQWVQLQTGDAQ
jgi:hypothetical protein